MRFISSGHRARPARLGALLVLSASAVALSACTGGASTTTAKPTAAAASPVANAQQVTVRGMDTMRFEPATVTVRTGQPVQVTLENGGQIVHDWTLEKGAAQPVKVLASGGQRGTAVFTPTEPGTYTFICSQPGHEPAGMRGTLTVQ